MRPPLVIALAMVIALGLVVPIPLAAAAPPTQEGGPNLLQDGDFEWSVPWDAQDGNGAVQVAPAWRAWWVHKPPAGIKRPYNCDGTDYGCYWADPEFGSALQIAHPYRVHGGYQAQKYFTYGRMHQAGIYQQVGGIQPGTRLRFSIYMQSWMCFKFDDCNYGRVSDQPSEMHLKIGIDPTGGDNPFSPDIVWSGEQAAWDHWVIFSVEATARNSTVTVFTHSRADWDWARSNNDVYVDDASLVALGQAPPTKAPTLAATRKPASTSTPRATETLAPTRTLTPTVTATPTDTPVPSDTPAPRVLALPDEETETPGPVESGLAETSGPGSAGGLVGLIFLGVALFLGALLVGVLLAGRRSASLAAPTMAVTPSQLPPLQSIPPTPPPPAPTSAPPSPSTPGPRPGPSGHKPRSRRRGRH